MKNKFTKEQRINVLAWDLVDEITGKNEEEDLEKGLIYALFIVRNKTHWEELEREEVFNRLKKMILERDNNEASR